MDLISVWTDFVDLIFPRCCEACNRSLIGNEETICTSCRISLHRVGSDSIHAESVRLKFVHLPEVISTASFLVFTKRGKVQRLLHALKYGKEQKVGVLLGKMLGEEMKINGTIPDANLILSVPLHRNRFNKRGYNQSDLIAEGLSASIGIPWSGKILERIKDTETQTGKDKAERRENVKGVFKVKENGEGKSVILVDDVLTTGATLEACILALQETGYARFHVRTIAVAEH
ncbi:hypothetical protein DYBT9275_05023 [Dyadobacter sp. CECT 9275]|uniref:Phosphoribosyltransferase domain-containing protein n=1 Tax=Dyadobacter helix TaxID=2822344 RepID=A0A916N6Y2_9BACT|nr:ComF family protein [Dyadobacter sp. CECT 9275]CAG5011779.1 hypothetical protein DYBT9275_05023 [Dyadobacter sp. CECT 9275]